MRWLGHLLAGRRANGERGVVLVITAVLVMFVAIGMLALTVDVGNITYNRAQLQNGADASSLALATACAQKNGSGPPCGVTPSLTNLAAGNASAKDQLMSILTDDTTCISPSPNHSVTTTLPNCPPPAAGDATSLSKCQPLPANVPATASFVQVTTQTEMKDGTSVLPFHFAQILSGEGTGSTHRTCARAAWGPAGSTGPTLPATISQCAYDSAISHGLAAAPPYTPLPNATIKPLPPLSVRPYVTAIMLHTTNSPNNCTAAPGQTYPGGFGWLATSTDPSEPGYPCVADITVGDPASGDTSGGTGNGNTGRPPPSGCKSNTILQSYVGKVVGVPIYNGYNGTGSGGTYNIPAVAAFYLAGYVKVNSLGDYSVYDKTGVCPACNGSDTYLWGWFVDAVLPTGGGTIGTGPDLGAHVVVPAG